MRQEDELYDPLGVWSGEHQFKSESLFLHLRNGDTNSVYSQCCGGVLVICVKDTVIVNSKFYQAIASKNYGLAFYTISRCYWYPSVNSFLPFLDFSGSFLYLSLEEEQYLLSS